MSFNGVSLRTHKCPQCSKPRLYWPIGETPSDETEIKDLPDGHKLAFYKNICEFCKIKNYKKYFEPKQSNMKAILKALKDGKTKDSLEDLL